MISQDSGSCSSSSCDNPGMIEVGELPAEGNQKKRPVMRKRSSLSRLEKQSPNLFGNSLMVVGVTRRETNAISSDGKSSKLTNRNPHPRRHSQMPKQDLTPQNKSKGPSASGWGKIRENVMVQKRATQPLSSL